MQIQTVKAWPIGPLDMKTVKLEGSQSYHRDNGLVLIMSLPFVHTARATTD